MKKKILIGAVNVLFLLLIFGIIMITIIIKGNSKIAMTQDEETIRNEEIENLNSEQEDKSSILEMDSEILEKDVNAEQLEDNLVSSDAGDSVIQNTDSHYKNETKQNSNSNTNNKKTETSSSLQTTTKPTVVQTTTAPSTETKTVDQTLKCTGNNHFMDVGNSGKWFDTEKDAIALYDSLQKEWSDKWTSDEVSSEEYNANCPYGYEDWSCICGKWTINFYFRT